MTHHRSRCLMPALGLTALTSGSPATHAAEAIEYPPARRADTTDVLHGESVPDPYRWMEEIDSEETRAWVTAQAALADAWLEGAGSRESIRQRIEELWDYEKVSEPTKRGGRVFFSRNSGLQNQSVLYWHEDREGAEPVVLLDPNTLSEDGTVALSGTAVSDDGRFLAYGLSESGSDWQTWRVREVATGEDLGDVIRWVKFSRASWSPDHAGFCYSRYDAPEEGDELKDTNYFQKVYYHRLGTPQSDDELVYERPDEKEWGFDADFSDDGRYLVLTVWESAAGYNGLFYRDRGQGGDRFVELFDDFGARYGFAGNDGSTFYIQTDLGAPNGRLVAVDLENPEPEHWRTVIPESTRTLESVDLFGGRAVATFLEDARSVVSVFRLADGEKLGDVALPGPGSVSGLGGRRDDTETFYTFSSFTVPGSIYRYDLASGQSTLYREPEVAFDPDAFETKQVFFESADGTRVPMFLCHKKGLAYDGTAPVIQYGYGGFNISLTPQFSVANLVWMERDGAYAQVTLRGGGEYGEAWHKAGQRANKQNVFDDFVAASEWLVANRVTSPKRLAIMGGSNGGLLVGACLVQRPDLYGAAIPVVGVLDMLRFQLFTIGWAWQEEYGFPGEADDFAGLRAYSPYHNLKAGTCYPPTMVMTGDHDDRVFPAHSFKFAAALQHAQGCPANPVLLRVDLKAGHGAGKPTAKRIDEAADRWAFLDKVLGREE